MSDRTFHLFLLIGQSNMAGRGELEPNDGDPHPRLFSYDAAGRWAAAADPLHFDKPAIVGVGPGLAFGKIVADRDPSIRVGLIPCAAGGSPIASWEPGGYWHQTDSHPYDDALARARAALQDGVLKGLLWHQGESNSNATDAPSYQERLIALIERLRADLDAPDAPFVAATLGDFFVARNTWASTVNQALRDLPQRVAGTACVEATGLAHKGDELHFNAEAARELGRRYAQAMIQFLDAAGG